jgi:hypothetical protein
MAEEGQIQTLQAKLNQRFADKLSDGFEYSDLQKLVQHCYNLDNQFADTYSRFNITNARNKGTTSASIAAPGGGMYTSARTGSGSGKITLPTKFRTMPLWSEDERRRCRLPGHRMTERDKCELKDWTNAEITAAQRGTVNSSATAAVNPSGSVEQGNGNVSS